MTISDLATLSTAVSGLAVTASLVYLAIQTHQATKHTQALIRQGRVSRLSEQSLAATDPGMATTIILANGNEATPEAVRRLQFSMYCLGLFYGFQDSFNQYQAGLLGEDMFKQLKAVLSRTLSQKGFRAEWQNVRVAGTKFAVFVDNIAAALPLQQ
ncbi:MAG: hypothetical protein JO208_01335 [Alphaproteobacteria bacterium]|nr:hypothetical protein [Alphaproteobacteria bacterium]